MTGTLLLHLLIREKKEEAPNNRLATAFLSMHKARLEDGRPTGKLLSDAIAAALRLMMVVGGLVVFFSVVMEVMTSAGAISVITSLVDAVFQLFGLPAVLSPAIVNGLFEVTLGVKAAGSAGGAMLLHQTAAAAWVLSWGGLSVHAQVVSLLSRTGMRYKPFIIARFAHGIIAMLMVYLLWGWLGPGI